MTETLRGIRCTLDSRQQGKEPVTLELLKRPSSRPRHANRDRAPLPAGFAGGLRRSELAAMWVEHLHWNKRGVTVYLLSSETDQEGQGREVELPLGA